MTKKRKRSKVSVVIPTFNEEKVLRKNLKALKAQTYKNVDIIVVDDGSTDGTVAALREVLYDRLRIVELRKNYGQSAALAAGIAEAKGNKRARIAVARKLAVLLHSLWLNETEFRWA